MAAIDFSRQLALMWQKKVKDSPGNTVVPDLSKRAVHEYVDGEKNRKGVTLEKYLSGADSQIADVWKNLDWNKLSDIRGLSQAQLDVARAIASAVNSKHMTAYSLTELMPSDQGLLNKEMLIFLLQNAGQEYLERLPALNDPINHPKASFGPYQLSEFSVFDAPGANTEQNLRGASVVNRAMRKGKIPGSVSKVSGQEHHKAAFMFAAYNLTRLVKYISPKEFEVLRKQWQSRPADPNRINNMLQFLGAVHHNEYALQSAQRWLDSGAKKDFFLSCAPIDMEYAKRTKINLAALESPSRLTHTERTVIVPTSKKR